MPAPPLTEAEVDHILSYPMVIDGEVRWRRKNSEVFQEMRLMVKHPLQGVNLWLRMTINLLSPKKFSIILLLNDEHRIVGLDVNGSHSNTHTD